MEDKVEAGKDTKVEARGKNEVEMKTVDEKVGEVKPMVEVKPRKTTPPNSQD